MGASRTTSPASSWRIERLGADGPDPTHRDELMLFGQFVGDWEITDCRILTGNGDWRELKGELHWRWILRGRATQDVWTLFEKTTGELFYEGTTVRLYVPETGTWASTWISTSRPRARLFSGRLIGDEIVLEELVEARAPQERWIFFDVTTESFRWRSEERRTANSTWEMSEEMRIQRRAVDKE